MQTRNWIPTRWQLQRIPATIAFNAWSLLGQLGPQKASRIEVSALLPPAAKAKAGYTRPRHKIPATVQSTSPILHAACRTPVGHHHLEGDVWVVDWSKNTARPQIVADADPFLLPPCWGWDSRRGAPPCLWNASSLSNEFKKNLNRSTSKKCLDVSV